MAIAKAGTDTSNTGTTLSLSYSHTLVSGSDRMVAVTIGVENGDTIDVSTITYGGNTMTKGVEGITGTSGFRFLVEVWYILEADLPSDGSNTVAITMTGTLNALWSASSCSEYTGVKQDVPEATDENQQTSGNTISNTISPTNNAWVISAVGCGNAAGSFTHGQGQQEILDVEGGGSTGTYAVAELRGANGETSLSSTYSGTVNRLQRDAISFRESFNMWVNDSGTFKKVTNAYVNDSGTWKEAIEVHVNDSGTWKKT